MPSGVYKRIPSMNFGKYKRTPEIREKMSVLLKKNPIRYWLGKKRDTPWFDGKRNGNTDYFKTHKFTGENHKHWKGNNVGYEALHTWIQRQLGKPDTCEFCGKSGLKGKLIHWANKSKKYKRELSDWLRLCAKCHYHYDRD